MYVTETIANHMASSMCFICSPLGIIGVIYTFLRPIGIRFMFVLRMLTVENTGTLAAEDANSCPWELAYD